MGRGSLLEVLRRGPQLGLRSVFLVVATALVAFLTGCGGATAGSSAAPSCADAILSDWGDGRIDGIYEAECYLAAIDALPEDVRAYSSAEDDISRALHSVSRSAGAADDTAVSRRLSQVGTETPSAEGSGLREVPVTLIALVGTALVVGAGGLAAGAARQLRRRR
jgi:hypothetical protein